MSIRPSRTKRQCDKYFAHRSACTEVRECCPLTRLSCGRNADRCKEAEALIEQAGKATQLFLTWVRRSASGLSGNACRRPSCCYREEPDLSAISLIRKSKVYSLMLSWTRNGSIRRASLPSIFRAVLS